MFIVIYVVLAAIAFFVAFNFFNFNPSNYNNSRDLDAANVQRVIKSAGVAVAVLIACFIQPFSIERIDAGNVGIKVSMVGDARGVGKYEYKTGWVIFNTWTARVYEFPTYQQHIDYDQQTVITRGGFQCAIKPSFNYSLKPGDVGDMFSSLRLPIKEVEQKWLQTAIVGTVNDVANRWTVDSLFNHRQEFESNIVVEVNKKIKQWFVVSQLRTNITPPDALRQSIEAKTRAIQEVQVAENQKQVKIAEGQMRVAEAKADSSVNVTKAAGDARAIRERQLSLTPIYIQYLKIQKWNGELPRVQPGSSGIILKEDK